jgi:hypothetical protein
VTATQENLNVTNTLVVDRWWVVAPGGGPRGPWPLERVFGLYAAGELDARAQVRPDGGSSWIPIARVLPDCAGVDPDQTPFSLTTAEEDAIESACSMQTTAEWPLAKPWPEPPAAPPVGPLETPLASSLSVRPSIVPPGPTPSRARAHALGLTFAAVLGGTIGAVGAIGVWGLREAVVPPSSTMRTAAVEPPTLLAAPLPSESRPAGGPSRAPQSAGFDCERARTVPASICSWIEALAAGRAAPMPSRAELSRFLAARGATPTVGRVLAELDSASPGTKRYLVTSQNVFGYCLTTKEPLALGSTYVRWVARTQAKPDAAKSCVSVEDAPVEGAVHELAFRRPPDPRGTAQRAMVGLVEREGGD